MVYGSVYGSLNESALTGVEPFGFDESMSFMEMGAVTLEESTNDWNNMMRAIALTELSYVVETGQELIYEAVDFAAIKDKVVKWFKDLWAKIQGIARTAMAKFASFGKNDEAFINKYTQYFKEGYDKIPSGFSFKGYKFNDDIISKAPAVVKREATAEASTAKNVSDFGKVGPDNFGDGFKRKVDQYRGRIVPGSTGDISQSQYTKALNKAFRGSEAKVYLNKSDIDVNTLINHVSGCKTAITDTKDAESAIKDSIDSAIDAVETMASKFKDDATSTTDADAAGKNRNASTYFTKYSDFLKEINQANATWFSTYISVLKERNRQSKAILVKLVGYANGVGGKKDSKTEAASILEDRFASIFAD